MVGMKRKYLKMKLKQTVKKKSTRNSYKGINEFKKGYRPRTNLAKDEKGDVLAHSHSTLNRLTNFFFSH